MLVMAQTELVGISFSHAFTAISMPCRLIISFGLWFWSAAVADAINESPPPLVAAKPQLQLPKRADDAPETDVPPPVEIPAAWLNGVELIPKTALGVRPEEADAYYRILDRVRRVPSRKLKAADREFRLERIAAYERRIGELFEKESKQDKTAARIRKKQREKKASQFRADPFSYPLVVDAFNRPQICQGKVVSFHGHARRLKKMPAGENDYGIGDLYELYLFDDEGRGAPVVVVFSELPPGFPTNVPENDVIDGVSARGYLFKMYAYEGQERLQAVPLILARTVEWHPAPPVNRQFPGWMYALLVVVGLVIFIFLFRRRDRDPDLEAARRRMSLPDDNPFENPGT